MRQSTQGERIFIQISGLFDERDDKIAASDVVCQIAEKLAAKRVVAQVLNNRAAIDISVGR